LYPPPKAEATDDIAEDKSMNYPGTVADRRKLKYICEYTEYSGNVDVSPNGEREAASEEVERDGYKESNGEEPKESRVSGGIW